MSILYIITQADGGGAQKYVLALAKHFKGTIAAGDEAQKLFDDARAAGIEVYPLRHLKRSIHPWHDFLAMWEIRRLANSLKPDIVHLNSTKAGILGSFACVGLNTKVIFTAHGFRFLEPMSFYARMFYLALEKVASSYRDFIITVSDADKKAALENELIAENKIQTIHNGIGQIQFYDKDTAKAELGIPKHKKVIGVIANNYPTKGVDLLEKAIKSKPIEGTVVAVIGQGFETKKSDDNIMYLGFRENASQYLKAFDILVLPSRKEGLPFVLLEAMQAGLPILAANVGGVAEALDNSGVLIPPEDSEGLAREIESLIKNDNRMDLLSKKAQERSKLFREERMLKETEKIYKKIL